MEDLSFSSRIANPYPVAEHFSNNHLRNIRLLNQRQPNGVFVGTIGIPDCLIGTGGFTFVELAFSVSIPVKLRTRCLIRFGVIPLGQHNREVDLLLDWLLL